MAEQNKATNPQHKADGKEEDTQSVNIDHVSACDGPKTRLNEERTDVNSTNTEAQKDDERGLEKALTSENTTSTEQTKENVETIGRTTEEKTKHSDPEVTGICGVLVETMEKKDNGEIVERADIPKGPCPDEGHKLNVEKNCTFLQANDGSHGDNNSGTPTNEESTETAEEFSRDDNTGIEKLPETTAPSTLDDPKDDQVDGPKTRLNEERTGVNDTNTETREDDERSQEKHLTSENTTSAEQTKENVETIGRTTEEKTKHSDPEVTGICGGSGKYLIAVCILGLAMLPYLLRPESPPQKNLHQIDIFLRQMEKVKSQFPNQRPELWKRSRIHLERHLNTTQPTEPVSLILTAGLRAERTLHCLAQGLASTFSSALNASVLHIDGASKAGQDSDQVKLDIDSQLQGAFEADKPVAVIHRFEELPPGSTLIFYRYCDHENAAYKETFLIFTVLLGEEEEIPAKIRLSTVEEMVDDHLQKKFLSHGHPVAFDRMDLDKYGGLWSRISHLILPVAAEKRIEHEGCQWT